ncbi:translocation/assembly module TamB domain-containing protein [Chelativorans sp. ZYF759]|uniref:translocation/assembly module TamB domain-containing protein n=1 Tax=Chelativorans sp. ZYF759 TaxID=2692213 RepID=UPI001FEFB182|nr:translocation/assembly module TamB domain-containing protein [Chelativorans sp. ZYF759]
MRLLAAIALFFALALPALAQDETPEEERSLFLGFVEDQLSGPNRDIRISNIQGVLSSNATIGLITVADNEGVWLRIVNASIVWSRSALLLQRRLEIETLSAELIEVIRQPVADETLPTPEATGFAVPELPLAINLANLEIELARFGPTVFGLESELAMQGRLRLEGGSLDTALEIQRLDGPGGQLSLTAQYANETQIIDLDLALSEPQDGVVANLLDIQGRPPIDLTIAGAGPISELDIELTLDADAERVLTGLATLRQQAEGLFFNTELGGPIARLVPAQFRGFFGEDTALRARGLIRDEGGLSLDTLEIDSAALSLQALAETTSDWFLSRLELNALIDDGTGDPVVLPVPGGDTTVDLARLSLAYGEAIGEEWSGALVIEGLRTPEFQAEDTRLTLSGLAQNLDNPLERRVTYAIQGVLDGITPASPEVGEALGDRITLDIDGEWNAGEPLLIDDARLSARALEIYLTGAFEDFEFLGEIGVETASIAPFSALAGRDLAGAMNLRANGEIWPLSGRFELLVDGTIQELRIDNPAVDNLMGGETRITGAIGRTELGLSTDDFRVVNEQFDLQANGIFATGAADFSFDFELADLALVSPQASGRLVATGRAQGEEGVINLTTSVDVPSGTLAGQRLSQATFGFEGDLEDGTLDGRLTGTAFLDGVRAELAGDVLLDDEQRRLSGFRLSAGGAQASGDIVQDIASGLLDGTIRIAAPDISTAAALFLVEAAGTVNADIVLTASEGRQDLAIDADLAAFRLDDTRVEQATLEATVADLFGVPAIEGTLAARVADVAGTTIETLDLSASSDGETTDFTAQAQLADNVTANAAGSLSPEAGGYRIVLESARLGRGAVAAVLTEPSSLLVVGDDITLDSLVLDVAGGRVAAAGTVAGTIDVALDIDDLPLVIANLVQPELGLGGTVNGTARITGARDNPDVAFTLQGRQIEAAALRATGISTLTVDARGTTSAGRLNIDATVASPEGLRATASGAIPLPDGQLALDIQLNAFPLAIVNRAAPGQNLGGQLTGTARVTGALDAPRVAFDIAGANVSAAPLQEFGIGALNISAAGTFADDVVTLTRAQADGPLGLTLSASGTLPVTGAGANLTFQATAPLALANRFLIDRGTQLAGTIQAQGTLTGSLDDPNIQANLTTAGAQVIDPLANIGLSNINLNASISGQTVSVTSLSAAIAGGGTATASGTISLDAAAGFPADLRLALAQARYADGDFIVATASGNLSITGPLARDPLIAGQIFVERADLSAPENLGGGPAAIDVIHRAPPPPVRATLERARANDGTPVPAGRPAVARLDIQINAPNRIFVRGRGLDAELGGSVRITGPVTSVQPVGSFELIRGRLGILGQRIEFDEGTLTLVGDLDPFVNLIARTSGQEITVIITVTGRISELDIQFSSQPELPEDEVLARLIFNRGIGDLSPLQIAQLAAAAAELAGGSDTSLLGSLREATGLDDIDIVSDAEGNVAVRAGRYIQENVYLGVEAGAQGTARATINLDITDEVRARGSLGTDGDSSLGIFFERDY